ncbi:MAG: Rpn family recombination-promoting nuclease/putative transposase [Candidatus Cryptobacteroides sp.]
MERKIYPNRFVPLRSDSGFKAVFMEKSNKDLLIGLLNHLLPDGVRVDDIVEYCDREQQQDTPVSKRTILDLICKGPDGSQYIVEVQRKFYDSYFERLVYYGAGTYRNPLMKGDQYFALRPVHVISITDYRLPHDDENQWDADHLISHYQFMETRTKELASSTISVNFAELERFDKSADECQSELDCLLYWFIHCGDIDIIPETIARNEFVSKLIDATELASMTPDQKLRFENDIMNELDFEFQKRMERKEGLEEGLAKGREEGREEGMQKGMEEEKVATARRMLENGLTIEMVAKISELPIETVRTL